MSDLTLGQLRNVLARHERWNTPNTVVRATTPHGSYTFEIGGVTITPLGISADAVMLHLREIPSMTTDHTEIRNSADDDVLFDPTCPPSCTFSGHEMAEKLRVARARNRESNRLFEESQDVAGIAVAEVKRLRKFIAEEFIMEMEGRP
jgi:hypothetical protein